MIYIHIFPISCIIQVDSVLSRMSSPIFKSKQNHGSISLIMEPDNMPRHILKMLSYSHKPLPAIRRPLPAIHRPLLAIHKAPVIV